MAAVPEGWRLTVRDTGTGLFADSRSERSGMGLDIMRHRAGLIGATFRIDSEAGKGTTVTCLVPRRRSPPETQP